MSEKQNKEEKIVKLKLDIIFKRIFGNENNKAIISKFISDLLEIPHLFFSPFCSERSLII